MYECVGGRALNGLGALPRLPNLIKLRMPANAVWESDSDRYVPLSKGKQPRSSAKVPKYMLSGKGCSGAQTTRRLA